MQELIAEKERISEVLCKELDYSRAQTHAIVTSTEYAGIRDAAAYVQLSRFAHGAADKRGELSVEAAQTFDLDRWLQEAAAEATPDLVRSLQASVGLDSQAGPFDHVRGPRLCAARSIPGESSQSAERSLVSRPDRQTLGASLTAVGGAELN